MHLLVRGEGISNTWRNSRLKLDGKSMVEGLRDILKIFRRFKVYFLTIIFPIPLKIEEKWGQRVRSCT